jgi:hypothetical protein
MTLTVYIVTISTGFTYLVITMLASLPTLLTWCVFHDVFSYGNLYIELRDFLDHCWLYLDQYDELSVRALLLAYEVKTLHCRKSWHYCPLRRNPHTCPSCGQATHGHVCLLIFVVQKRSCVLKINCVLLIPVSVDHRHRFASQWL